MTEIDALSARIRACADKHGVWGEVGDQVKKIRDKRINEDLYLEACRLQANANSQGLYRYAAGFSF